MGRPSPPIAERSWLPPTSVGRIRLRSSLPLEVAGRRKEGKKERKRKGEGRRSRIGEGKRKEEEEEEEDSSVLFSSSLSFSIVRTPSCLRHLFSLPYMAHLPFFFLFPFQKWGWRL